MKIFEHKISLNFSVIGLVSIWLLVVFSAISVAYVEHLCRQYYERISISEKTSNQLQADYGRLILELSTWGSLPRVETIAINELNMRTPLGDEIILVNPASYRTSNGD